MEEFSSRAIPRFIRYVHRSFAALKKKEKKKKKEEEEVFLHPARNY